MYIYIYIYIYHAALLSGYVVVAPQTSKQKLKCTTDITAFRLFDMTERLWIADLFSQSRLGNPIGHDFMSRVSSIQIIHWCCDRWTSHLCVWPKHWAFPQAVEFLPLRNCGRKGVGNEVGREKLEILHPQFCELPAHPPHAWREMSHDIKSLWFFFWMHNMWEMQHALWLLRWDTEQHVHEICSTIVLFETFFFEETLFHRCPLDYKQISASWHKAYSHTWISSKQSETHANMSMCESTCHVHI